MIRYFKKSKIKETKFGEFMQEKASKPKHFVGGENPPPIDNKIHFERD